MNIQGMWAWLTLLNIKWLPWRRKQKKRRHFETKWVFLFNEFVPFSCPCGGAEGKTEGCAAAAPPKRAGQKGAAMAGSTTLLTALILLILDGL